MKKTPLQFMLLIAGLFFAAILMTSCGKKAEQATEEHHHGASDSTSKHEDMPTDSTQTAFACPMHPEVTGKEGDKCSKCGMTLEAVKDKHEH